MKIEQLDKKTNFEEICAEIVDMELNNKLEMINIEIQVSLLEKNHSLMKT